MKEQGAPDERKRYPMEHYTWAIIAADGSVCDRYATREEAEADLRDGYPEPNATVEWVWNPFGSPVQS